MLGHERWEKAKDRRAVVTHLRAIPFLAARNGMVEEKPIDQASSGAYSM